MRRIYQVAAVLSVVGSLAYMVTYMSIPQGRAFSRIVHIADWWSSGISSKTRSENSKEKLTAQATRTVSPAAKTATTPHESIDGNIQHLISKDINNLTHLNNTQNLTHLVKFLEEAKQAITAPVEDTYNQTVLSSTLTVSNTRWNLSIGISLLRSGKTLPYTTCAERPDERNSIFQSIVCSPGWRYEPYFVDLHDEFLTPYLKDNGIAAQPGMGRREPVAETEIEAAYLATPRLQSMDDIPYEFKSKVLPLTPVDQVHKVGDRLRFRIDLYDLRGRPRGFGGDEIRAWLDTPLQDKTTVAAEVTDLGNGSYVAETILKWTGVTLVRVALTYPREFLRSVVELRNEVHSMRWITGSFFGPNDVKEITTCLAYLPLPGFNRTCNLTSQNGGLPWFCGYPSDPRLDCSHWNRTGNLNFLNPLPLSEPENQLVKRMDTKPTIKLIPNNIVYLVKPGLKQPDLPPCSSIPKRDTWTRPAPTGWLQAGSWEGHYCSVPAFDESKIRQCLQNTSLLFIGDSNARLFYSVMAHILGCPAQATWHSPMVCKAPWLNATASFGPHARPFNIGERHGMLQTWSVLSTFKELPADRQHIIVLHYYMHFTLTSLRVFTARVRAAAAAVKELLQRVPSAKILIRGPHVLYGGKGFHVILGDILGPWYKRIWKEEFKDLYDKVWFLDYWDLSIATLNKTSHPPSATILQMLKLLLSYVC